MRITKYILSLVVLIAAIGCQRRPLEYFYRPEAKIILKVDWSDFPEKPTGMTVFLFKLADLPAEVAKVVDAMQVGDISNPFQMIDDRGKTVCAIAKLKNRTEGHKATITEDEVKNFEYEYAKWRKGHGKKDGDGEAADDAPVDKDAPALRTISAVAHNVVSRLHVKIYFHNIPTLYSVRTSMEGLADSYLLTKNTTSQKEVAQLMEKWDIHVTSPDGVDGYVETTIHTFALPNGEKSVTGRDPQKNVFTVQALHKDLKTITEEVYTVGDKFKISFPGKIRMQMDLEVGPINLPYSPGGDAGGFISYVEDWDDVIDVPIPI